MPLEIPPRGLPQEPFIGQSAKKEKDATEPKTKGRATRIFQAVENVAQKATKPLGEAASKVGRIGTSVGKAAGKVSDSVRSRFPGAHKSGEARKVDPATEALVAKAKGITGKSDKEITEKYLLLMQARAKNNGEASYRLAEMFERGELTPRPFDKFKREHTHTVSTPEHLKTLSLSEGVEADRAKYNALSPDEKKEYELNQDRTFAIQTLKKELGEDYIKGLKKEAAARGHSPTAQKAKGGKDDYVINV